MKCVSSISTDVEIVGVHINRQECRKNRDRPLAHERPVLGVSRVIWPIPADLMVVYLLFRGRDRNFAVLLGYRLLRVVATILLRTMFFPPQILLKRSLRVKGAC